MNYIMKSWQQEAFKTACEFGYKNTGEIADVVSRSNEMFYILF